MIPRDRRESTGLSELAPLWSVMLPVYNAPTGFLEEALSSVLAQAPGTEEMQIQVIDHASTTGSPSEVARRLGGNRVEIHHEPRNQGLPYIMNLCVRRARGQWVHILHHDDRVLPGFYDELALGAVSNSRPGLLFCRHAFIGPDGHSYGFSGLEAEQAGLLKGPLERLATCNLIQVASAAVKRSVYETVGEFRTDLFYTLDWEMWCRIAARFPVWYEPSALACYRIHEAAETAHLRRQGLQMAEIRKCISLNCALLPEPAAKRVKRKAREHYALWAIGNTPQNFNSAQYVVGCRQILAAIRCHFSLRVCIRILRLWFAAVRRLYKGKQAHQTS